MALHFWSVSSTKTDVKKVADSETVGYVVAVGTWALAAGVYIAAKWAIAEMPPWTLCFFRVLIAFLVLLPIVRHHGVAIRELLEDRWLELLIIGGLGLAITQGLMYTAL
jgi:drug/metabolite transporter (DMT)-like permease